MSVTDNATSVDRDAFVADWQAWREASEARRRDPYGFLAYSSVHRLGTEPARYDGVPGTWSTGPDGPAVELLDGETLVVDVVEITGRHAFGAIAEREFRRAARFGDIVIELSRRGGVDLLRTIDPTHGLREDYVSTPAYEPDPAWVIRAEFRPFDALRDTEIDAALDGITHHHDAVGLAAFEVDGQEYELLFLDSPAGPGAAFAVFKDATSGVTTYAASRRIDAVLPEGGGAFELDFNRAGNLQCAYTDFSPCPLAPPQNRLTLAIEAGERTPIFQGSRTR